MLWKFKFAPASLAGVDGTKRTFANGVQNNEQWTRLVWLD